MHIAVCIKQIPDTNNVRWTKENNILREGMISILNPYDETGISAALKIKKQIKNTKISVFSMGPKQAQSVLEYALARGADEAFLLCDKKFAGSDTLITGKILSSAIKKIVPDVNLIICGQFALDGDTAQTGATIAGKLDIPVVSFVSEILNTNERYSVVKQLFEDGFAISEVKNPCVICVLKDDKEIPQIKASGWVRAKDIGIKTLCLDDLDLEANETGITGSPTFVSGTYRPKHIRKVQSVDENIPDFLCKLLSGEEND